MNLSFSPQFLANLQGDIQGAKNVATNIGHGIENVAGKAISTLRNSTLNPFSQASQTKATNFDNFAAPVNGPSLTQFLKHPITSFENIHTNPNSVLNPQNKLTPAQKAVGAKSLGDTMGNVAGLTGGIGKPPVSFPEVPPPLAEPSGPLPSNLVKPPPLPEPDVPKPAITAQPPLPQSKAAQAVSKFRSVVDPIVTENSKALSQMGNAGQALSDTIKNTYSAADVQAGQVYADLIKPLKTLTPAEQANFKAVSEGQAQPVSDRVQQLMSVYEKYRQDVAGKSEDLGLFQNGARQNYFPQVFDPKYVNNTKNAPTIIDHLVSTGQAENPQQAQDILKQVQDQVNGTSPSTFSMQGGNITRQFGNIEQSRGNLQLPPEAYKQNPTDVLTGYFQNAYKRINEAQNFGVNGEKIPDYLNAIGAEGGNGQRAAQIMHQVLGTQEPGVIPKDINMGARNFESAFKLGTSFVNHAGQVTNPITSKGLWNTLHAVGQYVTSPDKSIETALRSGSLNEQSLKASTGEMYQSWVSKLPWMKSLGNVMTFNRIIDANAAQFGLQSMVDRLVKNPESSLARRILQAQYGVNPEDVIANAGLKGEDFMKAINVAVNKDIPKFRAQDLPQAYSHPDFKLATQFKQFGFKQAQFVMDNVVKEAQHGNLTPLLRYITAGAVLGEGVADTKYGAKNAVGYASGAELKPRPQGTARVIDNIDAVGGAGQLSEAASQLTKGGLNAFEWIFGPTVSDTVKLATNTTNATQGKPAGLERQAIQQVPIVGNQAASQFVPPASRGRAPNPNALSVSGSTGGVPAVNWIK